MATTTDFQEWLDGISDLSVEEAYFLYESIVGVTQMGGFTCKQQNGMYFVKSADTEHTLMLASGKAVKAFLDKLDNDFGGDFNWLGGHYEFIRAMSKDD